MEKLVVPQIAPLYYCGQKVLSTPQLAALFKCNRANITDLFKYHRAEFKEGVDCFFLKSANFKAFRQSLTANGNFQPQANGNFQPQANGNFQPQANGNFQPQANGNFFPPFAHGATNIYLWTESGVAKLAKSIGTDAAKFIYSSLKFGYFQPTEPKPIADKKIFPNDFTPREKLEFLNRYIELCTDENLRDELIKTAANILINLEKKKCLC